MKRLDYVCLFACGLLMMPAVSAATCKKCSDKGYVERFIRCPLCSGHGTVSPAWFNKTTSTVSWTETTYLSTGVKTEDDYRYKKMSFFRCPCCVKSRMLGKLKTVEKCDCGAVVSESKIKEAVTRLQKAFKTKNHELEGEDINWGENGFKFFRICFETRCWGITDLRKDDGIRLLKQAISETYDTESAEYLRNANKKDLKDMWGKE